MSRRGTAVIRVLVEVPKVIGTLSHLYGACDVGDGFDDCFFCVCLGGSSKERHGGGGRMGVW